MKFNNINIQIGINVKIGREVKIGDNTVIYDNVEIGDNSIICNNCIIGEPTSSYYYDPLYKNPGTIIGANSLIRSHSIIYADSKFGDFLHTGHHVTLREGIIAGTNCSFGSYSDVQGICKFGNFVRLHSNVSIGQKSEIEDFVFIYPFVVLTNDPTPPSNVLVGAKVGAYTQVSTGVIVLPGATLGSFSLVAAGSTIGGTFPTDSFISGTPAKRIGTLSKMPFFNAENKRNYPWPYNFDRGMPWEGTDYNDWLKKKYD